MNARKHKKKNTPLFYRNKFTTKTRRFTKLDDRLIGFWRLVLNLVEVPLLSRGLPHPPRFAGGRWLFEKIVNFFHDFGVIRT